MYVCKYVGLSITGLRVVNLPFWHVTLIPDAIATEVGSRTWRPDRRRSPEI